MKDEFIVLRLLIFFSAGIFVVGLVLRTCREAAEQRARLETTLPAAEWNQTRIPCVRPGPILPCRLVPADDQLDAASPNPD